MVLWNTYRKLPTADAYQQASRLNIPENVSSFLSLIEYSLLDALNKVRSEEGASDLTLHSLKDRMPNDH